MEKDTRNNALLNFVEQVSGDEFLKVEENLGEGFVRLKTSEAERRQAKHDIRCVEDIIVELLRNARDAHATRIFVASSLEGNKRHLVVIDDGSGVPDQMKHLIFEPRVTSKLDTMVMDDWGVHGRGMALYSISQNTELCELHDTVVNGGSSLHIVADLEKLSERSDQSRWPKVIQEKDSIVVESGPKNLIRNIVEFALKSENVAVYFGSPADILATLFYLGKSGYTSYAEAIAPHQDTKNGALWKRASRAQDAQELAEVADALGLPVSQRNCYRIMNGEINALDDVITRITRTLAPIEKTADIYKDSRGLKIHSSDIAAFQVELEAAFDQLASKYFLSLCDEVKITLSKDALRATFNFEKEQ